MKLILGMGITGLSAARFFAKNNEIFRIADSRKNPALLKVFQEENLLDDCYFGDWNKSILKDIDEVVISPGIAQSEDIVKWIRERELNLISDVELFGRQIKLPYRFAGRSKPRKYIIACNWTCIKLISSKKYL